LFEIKLLGLRAFKYYTSTPPFVINKKYKRIKTKRRDEKNKLRKYIKSDQSTQYSEVQTQFIFRNMNCSEAHMSNSNSEA